MNSHQSKAVWRLEWLAMATGSPGTTGTTGPRPWPTPSWKEEELSGLGEGTEEKQREVEMTVFDHLNMMNVWCLGNYCLIKSWIETYVITVTCQRLLQPMPQRNNKQKKEEPYRFYCYFLLLTSIKAPYSPRHRLSEDHPVLLGGSSVLNMRVVVHANLKSTHMKQTHEHTQGNRNTQIFFSIFIVLSDIPV